jgi:CubicO group peptidase (beta-lactamase class C family)
MFVMETTEDAADLGIAREAIARAAGILEEAVARGDLMGAALQVSRNGLSLAPKCFGRRALEADGPAVEPDTIFLVASVTKPIVAAAAALLIERGRISLDDTVAELVPEFGQNGKQAVQVRHLLTHTSGLPDMLEENLDLRAQHAHLDTFVERICRTKLLFEPGTRISYQSTGIAMLGEIVKRVEGMPIRAFLKRAFFEPLGLRDTSLGMQPDRRGRMSQVKIPGGEFEYGARGAPDWNWNSDYWLNFGAPWGGMLTTVGDMTTLCRLFLNDGRVGETRILSPPTVRAMTTDQTSHLPGIPESDRLARRWGLGWRLKDRASSVFGDFVSDATFGHEGATGTVVWMDPETATSFVLFTNDPRGAAPLRPCVSNAIAAGVDG